MSKLNEAISVLTRNGMQISKQSLIRKIYAHIAPIGRKMYGDEYWKGVKDIQDALHECLPDFDISIWCEDGGYRTSKDGLSKWKQYELEIKHDELKYAIRGQIICSAAGTMDDPFKYYDVTTTLS